MMNKKFIAIALAVSATMLLLIQILFFHFQGEYSIFLTKAMQGLLRSEITNSDPHEMARSIDDYESIKLLKCSKITVAGASEYLFADLSYKNNCNHISDWLLNGAKITTTIKSVSGVDYRLEFISINTPVFIFALWITRILSVLLTISLFFAYYKKRRDDERVFNLEKDLLKTKAEKQEVLVNLASQVSHDIRSPLTALSSSAREWIHMLPEQERITVRAQIQRIQDIANSLLKKRKEIQSGNVIDDASILAPQMLSSCLEEIVTEKRMNFRQHLDLHIEARVDQTYGIFANVNVVEFKRILSNLINNAVEAYDDRKGVIEVQLREDDLSAIVSVIDHGKGIPPEILAKLGQEGVSHGKQGSKESGNGLGVAHAKRTIEKWGGSYEIASVVGSGTTTTITLPKSSTPHWFVSKIVLDEKSAVVILDDDQGIHQTWDRRLNVIPNIGSVAVVHVSTPDDFSAWVENKSSEYSKVLYLCDYELLGHQTSGLQLIEKHGLKTAYLVTSHYEEEKIRAKCKELGVKLIPKMLAGLVPIELKATPVVVVTPAIDYAKVQAVYVDDEPYNRKDWERHSKNENIKLLTFEAADEFFAIAENLDKENCAIYLDRELGEGLPKGEVVAEQARAMGFKKISLATSHMPELFAHIPWLAVAGKECPWAPADSGDDW